MFTVATLGSNASRDTELRLSAVVTGFRSTKMTYIPAVQYTSLLMDDLLTLFAAVWAMLQKIGRWGRLDCGQHLLLSDRYKGFWGWVLIALFMHRSCTVHTPTVMYGQHGAKTLVEILWLLIGKGTAFFLKSVRR